ncbi:uncharacterized protein LOC108937155 [Scleropages formosus]|uniref:uncharacterized protein LOC108937155 n=1 Tax=Scleropages formosus TaxID=113540 RepID=UPI0008788C2C|nr:uncharacterized protein LOC108937155 [Scleropages formosus]
MAEQELLFEGYLRKRRDKMKMKWVTYWFRLESTTLFFYSKKDGRAINLRGQYYLCMVESVRKVNRAEGKRYVFEINMKNGKKKLLAAESEHLRQSWVASLWKAIGTSGPTCADPTSVWRGPGEKKLEEEEGISLGSSDSDSGKGVLNGVGISTSFGQWDSPGFEEIETRNSGISEPTDDYVNWRSLKQHWEEMDVAKEDDLYETLELRKERTEEPVDEEGEEDYYAVPPPRRANSSNVDAADRALAEDIYDYPLSYRNSDKSGVQEYRECTESIYDVPQSLLKKFSEQTIEVQSDSQSSAHSDALAYDGMWRLRRDSLVSWAAEVKEG